MKLWYNIEIRQFKSKQLISTLASKISLKMNCLIAPKTEGATHYWVTRSYSPRVSMIFIATDSDRVVLMYPGYQIHQTQCYIPPRRQGIPRTSHTSSRVAA